MRGCLTIAIVCLTLASTSLGAQQVTPVQIDARKAELERVFDAYAGGDHEAVARAIPRKGLLRPDSATRLALTQMLGDKKLLWNRARAAFTIEVAVAFYRTGGAGIGDMPRFVRLGQTMVTSRAVGADVVDDRFEALWHQIALALLQGAGAWDMHNDYVTAINPRIVRMAQVDPPVPNRLALARALNATMQCCRTIVSTVGTQILVITSGRADPNKPVVRPNDALAMFDAAAEDPHLRDEALVRAALLESFLKRLPEALTRLDRAAPTDDTLAYAAALIKGGVLDQMEKPAAAADAYGLALQLAPTIQTPAIGRAAALQRAGRLDEARAAADQARKLRAGGVDHWPIFVRADERFINQWLLELRTLLR